MTFQLTSSAFAEGSKIPIRFTCDGENVSPPLRWSEEPAQTRSFALIAEDPDAPAGTWTHWLIWDIPSYIHSIPESNEHAAFGKSGPNDFGSVGYGGPCPPRGGGSHRYFFHLFAVNEPTLGLNPGSRRAALDGKLKKHALAEASYMGRYERPAR